MSAHGKEESTNTRRQFSLARLMTWVLAAGVLFGVFHLCFDSSTSVPIKMTLALGSWSAVIVLFVATGQLKTLVEYLVFIVGGLIFVALLLPPISFPHRRHKCQSNVSQIAAAMVRYEIDYDCLPPPYIADADGKPMHSWRVLLLPYLGERQLYDQYHFDEPWDGPNNNKLHNQIVDVYRCPEVHPNQKSSAALDTSYVVIVGPGTAYPDVPQKISVTDIANGDGASNSILIVEIADSGIHWMEPRDLHVTQMARTINAAKGQGISSKHKGGANVAMADGSVRFLSAEETTADDLQSLLTIDDNYPRK